ncbi:MAG: TolC family protein [Gemmatimonadota bacterium]
MQGRAMVALAIGAGTCLIFAHPLWAQETVDRVTLEEALTLFAKNNLQLQIARADARTGVNLARQAAAYPNPAVSVTHETLGGVPEYSETYLNLSQSVEWPWLSGARRREASRMRDALEARVAADSVRLVFEVKRAFLEAAAAERTRDALEEATALVRHAESQAMARAAGGDISEYELLRLQVERARHEVELAAIVLALGASRRTLTSLITPDSLRKLAPVRLPEEDPPHMALLDALAAATAHRPELLEAASLTAAAQGASSVARAERLPVPTLTAGYKDQSDGRTGAFLGVALSLPLFNRNGANVAASEAAVQSAQARHRLILREIQDDVRRAYDAYVAARERVNLLHTNLIADTDALLRIGRVAYEEGEMTLVELFDAVDAFRVAHVLATDTVADLWIGYYNLERAVGTPLHAWSTEEVR